MTAAQFQRFAATLRNTEGYSEQELAAVNRLVFAQVASRLEVDGSETKTRVRPRILPCGAVRTPEEEATIDAAVRHLEGLCALRRLAAVARR